MQFNEFNANRIVVIIAVASSTRLLQHCTTYIALSGRGVFYYTFLEITFVLLRSLLNEGVSTEKKRNAVQQ